MSVGMAVICDGSVDGLLPQLSFEFVVHVCSGI
jgi:hypothetical protein